MPLAFPPNPDNGDVHTDGALSWTYNDAIPGWEKSLPAVVGNLIARNYFQSDTSPVNPQNGDQWLKTDTLQKFERYAGAWVDVAGALVTSAGIQAAINSGPFTFGGKLVAAGQGALGAMSPDDVVTRSALSAGVFEQCPIAVSWAASTGSVNSSGSTQGDSFQIVQSGVAGNYREALSAMHSPLTRPGSGSNMPLANSRFTAFFDVYCNGLVNSQVHLIFGASGTGGVLLSGAGFSVVWLGNTSVKIQIHNGATLLESDPIAVVNLPDFHRRYLISWDGSKVILGESVMAVATSSYPNFTKIGELAGSGIPALAGGPHWKANITATGAAAYSHTFYVFRTLYVPYAITL